MLLGLVELVGLLLPRCLTNGSVGIVSDGLKVTAHVFDSWSSDDVTEQRCLDTRRQQRCGMLAPPISWHSRIADRTFGTVATNTYIRKSTNGTPTIATSSFEQTHYIIHRRLEIRSPALRFNTVPDDTMRNHKSPTQEKEEGAKHVPAI